LLDFANYNKSSHSKEFMMQASAWSNGGVTYGIRVDFPNRERFCDQSWTGVEIEIDGKVHQFAIRGGFWRYCLRFETRASP
jgi:hypothetical protein